ncbi:class II glutamine amidotransferase [Candidatus Bathyarchaeota archaeon]|nr:class II glutamine amidotransferase [Candidatus Bathyarchaeota archaeon]
MLSVKPSNALKYLISDPCSLYAQSKTDPRRLQGDGWGVGFYINGSLKTVKSEKPVFEEYERFGYIVNSISSNVIVAHVRRASNPRGLPKEKLLSIENSQPFCYKNYVFAHNGVINLPDEMANLLGDWQPNIKGLNDSEVYFWYIMKEISEGRSISEALRNFQRDLHRVWLENRDKYPDKDSPFIGLNIIFSDGEKLYAYCKYDEERDGRATSLCYSDQPAMQMSYIYSPEKLVVVSEKTNLEEDWQPLMSGHLIIGQVVNEKVGINVQKI